MKKQYKKEICQKNGVSLIINAPKEETHAQGIYSFFILNNMYTIICVSSTIICTSMHK